MWMLPRLTNAPRKDKPLHISQFPFTNHRITLTVFPQQTRQRSTKSAHRWFSIAELDSIPLPSPHRRALEKLLTSNHKTIATP
jgi:A/G-specific adenine glycosylase